MSQEIADFRELSTGFRKIGIKKATKITDTLQGSIWRASIKLHGSSVSENLVIKVTDHNQHANAICVVDQKEYHCQEDIVLEQSILKYLTECSECPSSIVKFRRFYKTTGHFYLLMEDGGLSLFDFVKNAHKVIDAKKLSIREWLKVVQRIFRQMIECIAFIHSHNVCHNDISLENWLVNDVDVQVPDNNDGITSDKIIFVKDDIVVKLCDFGLAEMHDDSACISRKHCGKTIYKSPEIEYQRQWFEGKKNDVWSLGVSLFMMIFGCPPWSAAHMKDTRFNLIMNGYIRNLLRAWEVDHYADDALIDLLECIFEYEEDRIDVDGIKKHPWYKNDC
eukprot:201905_1